MARGTRAFIDLDALEHNFLQVKALNANASVMAVVKSDAYGHGVLPVASRLAPLCDSFAVATCEEGVRLRTVVGTHPIVVLSAFQYQDEIPSLHDSQLTPVIHDHHQLDLLSGVSRRTPVWLKLNSGMNRTGFSPNEFGHVVSNVQQRPNLELQGVMSHLACADDPDSTFTNKQATCFAHAVNEEIGVRSLANSAGIVAWPDTHYDVVRPGIMLYGVSPIMQQSAQELSLRSVMRFESRLIAIKDIVAGDSVGYGQTYTAQKNETIGLVGCGYGDGYPRLVKDGTPVQLGDKLVPKCGRVSMDSFAVNLTDHPEAAVGDSVILWGDQIPVEQVAHSAGTIAYETLCQVTARVPRIYHSSTVMDLEDYEQDSLVVN